MNIVKLKEHKTIKCIIWCNIYREGHNVKDVCANLETGRITSIIVPGGKKLMSMFAKEDDIVIEWEKIKCIGDDIILVDI